MGELDQGDTPMLGNTCYAAISEIDAPDGGAGGTIPTSRAPFDIGPYARTGIDDADDMPRMALGQKQTVKLDRPRQGAAAMKPPRATRH
jgi:hypothetical protein